MSAAAWAALIEGYVLTFVSAGQSQRTAKLRSIQLTSMARELGCPASAVTPAMLEKWFGGHPEWEIETRRSRRAAARGFFAWAAKYGHVSANPALDLTKVAPARPMPKPAPDRVWQAALAAARPRVTLMLRLAAEAGLRRAEVAQVHTRDLLDSAGGPQLLVHGKGGKKRVVPLSDDLAELVSRGAAGHTKGAASAGYVFPGGTPGGHLAPITVGLLCAEALPEGWTMHTLRHRFATRAYRGTRNLRAVQTLLGHASIVTTERYTAVDDDEIRAAMLAAIG
ncbi:tyrosine-type recombinase/integrase [Mycolicibacterium fortuitum]|uniref:tyrosine-type recombinase/integrase n=1 Tax=Mycolicibacterium fortuitum TaxID=1766 RepID=UPI0030137661